MAKITSTIWKLDPHTEAKHIILRKYLNAWLPIMSHGNKKIIYIDGFAGPGEYIGGEDGSPIIAIKAVMEHVAMPTINIRMLFIEPKQERCDFLAKKISSMAIPANIKIDYSCDTFEKSLNKLLDYMEKEKASLAPAFVFIDPFGYTGMPMKLIARIMNHPKCEVLINFMFEEINRFISLSNQHDNLCNIFGTDEWKKVLLIKEPRARANFLHGLYTQQLEQYAKIQFVRSFKMINKSNKEDYFLFFGTNKLLGIEKMKDAMWKVDESGAFQFADVTHNPSQSTLFSLSPDFGFLKKLILGKFKGKSVSINEIKDFVLTQTPFRATHYKTQILANMEKADPPEIEVSCGANKRRKGKFPDGCVVKFL